jgi:SAM-dependent methyltransferase
MTNLSHAEWTDLLLRSLEQSELFSPHGDPLPRFPERSLQENTTGLSADAAVRQALGFYEETVKALSMRNVEIAPSWRLLDFGCGWGRVTRCFMRDLMLSNMVGIDVDSDFVDLSNSLFGSPRFMRCDPFPPTDLSPGTIDLVTAYSVFSHLSEAACDAWMDEFHRMLKPGGWVSITTRHESFFDYCAWAASQESKATGYLAGLGGLFPNIDEARTRYRRGELVHATSAGVSGGGPRNESFYGETFIPENYFRTAYSARFDLVHFGFEPAKFDQAIVVLRKK